MGEQEGRDPDNWDFENAETRSGVQRSRAVVSVAFNREDFERVAESAEAFGMKVSEFIRTAALDRARPTVVVVGTFPAETQTCWGFTPERKEDIVSARSAPAKP